MSVICTDCKQEIFPGEEVYMWEYSGICPECFLAKVFEMSTPELADLMNTEHHTIPKEEKE